MTLMNWLSMGLIFDIASVVLFSYIALKVRKLSKNQKSIEEDLLMTMANPQKARRIIKQRIKQV